MIPVKNGSPFDGIRPVLSILFVLIVFILQQGRQALLHTGHDWIFIFISPYFSSRGVMAPRARTVRRRVARERAV